MLPQSQQRKPKNSSKSNLIISFIFHAILVVVIVYFAAREGLLGKKMETLSVNLVKEKPKPPEKPPEPPKVVEPPKIVEPPRVVDNTPKAAPPPPDNSAPTVAPPPAELPGFDFGGGHDVESADPVHVYKDYMERTLKAKWDKPDGMDDDNYVVEMGVTVEKDGRLGAAVMQKSSNNEQWDETVKQVFSVVKKFDLPPPTNFPPAVTIRFDVELEEVDSILQ
jgi:outer membrane biosynthesis protein TonB